MEADVERALKELPADGRRFGHQDVADPVWPATPSIPEPAELSTPDLAIHDRVPAGIS